jgi:hypothetical protein
VLQNRLKYRSGYNIYIYIYIIYINLNLNLFQSDIHLGNHLYAQLFFSISNDKSLLEIEKMLRVGKIKFSECLLGINRIIDSPVTTTANQLKLIFGICELPFIIVCQKFSYDLWTKKIIIFF